MPKSKILIERDLSSRLECNCHAAKRLEQIVELAQKLYDANEIDYTITLKQSKKEPRSVNMIVQVPFFDILVKTKKMFIELIDMTDSFSIKNDDEREACDYIFKINNVL